MRDFLTSKKDELKFIYNFHTTGNMFFIPFAGKYPSNLMNSHPWMHKLFSEIVNEAQFPKGMKIGTAPEVLYEAGGDAADWAT